MTDAANTTAVAEGPWAQSVQLAFRALFVAVGLLALGWAMSNIREVPAADRAVVLRFGAVARIEGAGLLLAWPRPIEQVLLLPGPARQLSLRIERFDAASGSAPAGFQISADTRRNDGFLLTGDLGIVHLQATLLYQITDPAAYLLAGPHLEPALQRLFIASAIKVAASRDLDAILVARAAGEAPVTSGAGGGATREQLRADLLREVNHRLTDFARQGTGLGVTASRVDLAAALPATVKDAFDRVLAVGQTADRVVAQARTYAAAASQQAVQTRDRILTEARASAEERVSQATTRTASIAALGKARDDPAAPAMLQRLYAERVAALLHRAKQVDTVDPDSGAHLILPGAGK